jgi:hypothetical protein
MGSKKEENESRTKKMLIKNYITLMKRENSFRVKIFLFFSLPRTFMLSFAAAPVVWL